MTDLPANNPENEGSNNIDLKHIGAEIFDVDVYGSKSLYYRKKEPRIARIATNQEKQQKISEIEDACGHKLDAQMVVWTIERGNGILDFYTDDELRKIYEVESPKSSDQRRKVYEIFRAIKYREPFIFVFPDGREEHKPAKTVILKFDNGDISFMSFAEFEFTATPWDRDKSRPLSARHNEKGSLPANNTFSTDDLINKLCGFNTNSK